MSEKKIKTKLTAKLANQDAFLNWHDVDELQDGWPESYIVRGYGEFTPRNVTKFIRQHIEQIFEIPEKRLDRFYIKNIREAIGDSADASLLTLLDELGTLCQNLAMPDHKQSSSPIQADEIDNASDELSQKQQQVVEEFQKLLNSLAGRRGKSRDEDKKIAKRVHNLAQQFGLDLMYDNQRVQLVWNGGVFRARIPGISENIVTSAEFLPLQAQPRILRDQKESLDQEESPSTVTDDINDVRPKKPTRKRK